MKLVGVDEFLLMSPTNGPNGTTEGPRCIRIGRGAEWAGEGRRSPPRRGKGCGKSHEKITTQVIQHHCHNNSDDENHDVMKLYLYISLYIQVVPGRAGGGSFRRKKKYIAKKEFAYRMCARRPTSAMPKPFLCCERAFCCSMVVMCRGVR